MANIPQLDSGEFPVPAYGAGVIPQLVSGELLSLEMAASGGALAGGSASVLLAVRHHALGGAVAAGSASVSTTSTVCTAAGGGVAGGAAQVRSRCLAGHAAGWRLHHAAQRGLAERYRICSVADAVLQFSAGRLLIDIAAQQRDTWDVGVFARGQSGLRASYIVSAAHCVRQHDVLSRTHNSGAWSWCLRAALGAIWTLVGDARAGHRVRYRLRQTERTAAHGNRHALQIASGLGIVYGSAQHRNTVHRLRYDPLTARRTTHILLDEPVETRRIAHVSHHDPAAAASRTHRTHCADLPRRFVRHATRDDPLLPCRTTHRAPARDAAQATAAHGAFYALRGIAAAGTTMPYCLDGRDRPLAAHTSRHALISAVVWPAEGRAALRIAGRDIPCIAASVSADWGAATWMATIEADPEALNGIPLINAPVALTIAGRRWALVVIDATLSSRIGADAFTLTAASPFALRASPPAAACSAWSAAPRVMSVWAAQLAGQPIAWNLPDDPVIWPDARGEDAFDALKRLAATPGGVLYADPDGGLSAWPWRGTGRGTAALAADEVIELSVRRLRRAAVGAVTVANTPADMIEFDPTTKIVTVIASRLRTVTLDHSAPGHTVLRELGTDDAEVCERLEIKAGRGSVAHPILSLSRIVWHGMPLSGEPLWRPGQSGIAWADDGYSVATIHYIRRAHQWRLDTDRNLVQLLVKEEVFSERYHDNAGG